MTIPFLILGDGPDLHGGLSRIGQDLAWQLSALPEIRLGYLGRGAQGRAKFPWAQYSYPVTGQWGEDHIENVWTDLSQGQKGVILTIWDASRLLWFADPIGMPEGLQRFLGSGKFERWGYFMQDAMGVNWGRLPMETAHVMSKYDRVLLASKWAYEFSKATLPEHKDLDWLPHGINRNTFKPVDRMFARSGWGVKDDEFVIGCLMANQDRKHWSTVIEAVARMPENPRLWIHTDRTLGYWDINALATECGIADRVIYEGRPLKDAELAMRYSACDCTVVISGGEGFCYPVAESLSCGCPVVTGSYGAQLELTLEGIKPVATRLETTHNVRRAVYDAGAVTAALSHALAHPAEREQEAEKVSHLDWMKIGLEWRKYFKKGLERFK